MSNERRLRDLYPSLSVEERLALYLGTIAEDREPDPFLTFTMPSRDLPAWREALRLHVAINHDLVAHFLLLEALVGQADLRLALWLVLQSNVVEAELAMSQLVLDSREPVTESTYAQRVAVLRDEHVPIAQLAEWLEDGHGEATGGDGQAAGARLLAAVSAGHLQARKTRKGPSVSVGAFDDWRGRPTLPSPEWGIDFDVRPDNEASAVEELRQQREARRAFLIERRRLALERAEQVLGVLAAEVAARWADVRVCLLALDRMTDRFGGYYPLEPEHRDRLAALRGRVNGLVEALKDDIDLPTTEPDVERVQELIRSLAR